MVWVSTIRINIHTHIVGDSVGNELTFIVWVFFSFCRRCCSGFLGRYTRSSTRLCCRRLSGKRHASSGSVNNNWAWFAPVHRNITFVRCSDTTKYNQLLRLLLSRWYLYRSKMYQYIFYIDLYARTRFVLTSGRTKAGAPGRGVFFYRLDWAWPSSATKDMQSSTWPRPSLRSGEALIRIRKRVACKL